MEKKLSHVYWQDTKVSKEERHGLNGHKSFVVWFTGLSGSGKTTLARAVEAKLFEKNTRTFLLDGDNVRHGLCQDLGFSSEDRTENIRRVGEVAKLMVEAGVVVLASFISPFASERQKVRELLGGDEFIEVYVKCPLQICEERDVKGLYKKARAGEIKEFTGIDSPYEEPKNPEILVCSDEVSIDEAVLKVTEVLAARL